MILNILVKKLNVNRIDNMKRITFNLCIMKKDCIDLTRDKICNTNLNGL